MNNIRWVARWLFFVAMYAQFRETYGPTAPERPFSLAATYRAYYTGTGDRP
jgi:hypothetical protein